MNCERTRALLGAHLDGELDAVNDRELQLHLRECPRCLAAADQQQTLSRMVRQAAPYQRAPTGLDARIRASLRSHALPEGQAQRLKPPPRRASWFWQWTSAAATLAAVVVAVWIGAAVTARRAAGEFLAEELVSAHVRSLQGAHLTDVQSSDQHTVKPWFDGKVDFAPPVRDLAAEGFPLLGGRLDYLAGHPAAALVFQRNKHFINVFVWPAASGPAPSAPVLERRGYNLVSWRQGDLTFCAVSDLKRPELESFAASYRGK
jgi:anti-sigma factor (TIGR02949 family)